MNSNKLEAYGLLPHYVNFRPGTAAALSAAIASAYKRGDTIAILHDGNVVQIGGVDNILNNPADDYVSAFTREIQNRR